MTTLKDMKPGDTALVRIEKLVEGNIENFRFSSNNSDLFLCKESLSAEVTDLQRAKPKPAVGQRWRHKQDHKWQVSLLYVEPGFVFYKTLYDQQCNYEMRGYRKAEDLESNFELMDQTNDNA